jgi:hypothetical protein
MAAKGSLHKLACKAKVNDLPTPLGKPALTRFALPDIQAS